MADRKRPRDARRRNSHRDRLSRIEKKLDRILEAVTPDNLDALNRGLGRLERASDKLKDSVDQNDPQK